MAATTTKPSPVIEVPQRLGDAGVEHEIELSESGENEGFGSVSFCPGAEATTTANHQALRHRPPSPRLDQPLSAACGHWGLPRRCAPSARCVLLRSALPGLGRRREG